MHIFSLSFVTRVANYKLPMFSEAYDCTVEVQYTYMKLKNEEKLIIIFYLANTFSSINQCTVYAELPSFLSPCLITGDSLRPDLLLFIENNVLYILELTICFDTHIQVNSLRNANKYTILIKDLSSTYSKVAFINLSMGALGIMGSFCDSFLSLLQDLNFEKFVPKRNAMRVSIAIRSSYYIFYQRNKSWNNPELLEI